jgi:glycosyltransferase involved in cell wall biosynthesis
MNVSIIIPAFNAEKTIAQTLESLLAQTSRKWEAIVVDDGSTDRTASIAKEIAKRDKRIRIVRQPNRGQSAARNAGLARARYGWLLFLDSDDWIAPAYLERMTAALGADATLDAVHCLYARVASDETLVFEQYMPPTGDMFPTLARRATFPPHACVLRRSLLEVVGLFDTSLRASPDWDFFQRIARAGARFGAVREVLAFYRMSLHSASQDAHRVFDEDLLILRRGHSKDPRVKRPHPDHVKGQPADQVRTQVFYLLCWCAGLLLARGEDARPLLDKVGNERFPELYP